LTSPRLRQSLVALALLVAPSIALADDDPQTAEARAAFVHGTELVHEAKWAEGLAAFEQSAKLKPHAITTYNVGACQRALGRYAEARKTLHRALAENDANGGQQLPEALITETKGYLDQIDKLLATMDVTLDPGSAAITVDGRPLEVDPTTHALVADVRPPGAGETPPSATFKMVLDPGVHVITLSRKGYSDAVINKTLAPGSSTVMVMALDKLPATFHIEADQPSAIVKFAGADVGVAPIDVSRPGGTYKVAVQKSGFVTYEATVVGQPGEAVDLRAKLPAEKPSILSRWWFWTVAGVVVAGAATATYFIVRANQEPTRPGLNGGGLGWSVQVPGS
jgi:hypothetical protein